MTAWTPAALSPDLPPGVVVPSACDGIEVAIWRGRSGGVAAWVDRCPHRGMRLSHGFVRGDLLSCIYHGWRFDGGGRCRRIPAHRDLDPPDAIRATALSCAEAGGVVWIAREAPAAPPPALDGLRPLRSLTVEAGAEALAEAAEARLEGGTLRLPARGGASAVTLLLQSTSEATVIHALAEPAPPAALVAASRALEDLRRKVEAA